MLLAQSAKSAQAGHSDFTSSDGSHLPQLSISAMNNRLSPKMHELLIKYQALHGDSKAGKIKEAASSINQAETADVSYEGEY